MKKLYRHFLVLLVVFLNSDICLSISSGSQTSQNVVSTNPNSFYGYIGNLVYKQDSLGNTIWVKDFSGHFTSQTNDSNQIISLTSDGSFIYISAMQEYSIGAPFNFFPAIIVMDTNGLVISIRYDNLSPSGGYYFGSTYPSFKTGGAWFLGGYSTGINHYIEINKVDSTGNFMASFAMGYSSSSLSKFGLLNDSSFLAQTTSSSGTWFLNFQIVKLDEFGGIDWAKEILNSTIWNFSCGSSGIDLNTGNSCLFYIKDAFSSNSKTIGLLFSGGGSLIAQREWPDSLIKGNGQFKMINNQFCYDDGQSLFKFDTSLIDSCLGPGGNPNLTIQNYSVQGGLATFPNTSLFVPTPSGPMVVSPISNTGTLDSTSQDYCFILSSDHDLISHVNTFTIFPNPVNNSIHINSNIRVEEFQISDMNCRIIKSGIFESDLKVDDIEPGIYFLRIQGKDGYLVERFIKL